MRRGPSARAALFAITVLASAGLGVGYAAWAASRGDSSVARSARTPAAIPPTEAGARLVFQHYSRARRELGNVGVVLLEHPARRRIVSGLICERVYYAGTTGLCLKAHAAPLGAQYRLKLFGSDFKIRKELTLTGIPSRARISADGRYGAVTAFVFGHSYKDANFSTQTLLIDMATGNVLADLETFELAENTAIRASPDFNYWGVTFARDSNRFYATLRTRGRTYLVEGDADARSIRVLRENAECPSISPDNARIVFKKWDASGNKWRLHALDLSTMVETPLAEMRSVDDQVEWLDNRRILYGADEAIWTLPADGSGSPRKLLPEALSPAVVRS